MTASAAIRAAARELGAIRVGFSSAHALADAQADRDAWNAYLAAGRHAEMAYLARGADRTDVRSVLEDAQTVVSLAFPCVHGRAAGLDAHRGTRGYVARFARGPDYHDHLRGKLEQLAALCREIFGSHVRTRACVDTAPLLERAWASCSGLGFLGKSTLLIVPGIGSHVVLGELLLGAQLPVDRPLQHRCGRCVACLQACPTGALVAPYTLDARRCIAYLTIELRGAIPTELRPLMGTHLFGCDACQDCCPYNAGRQARSSPAHRGPEKAQEAPFLEDVLRMGSGAYRRMVAGTTLRRTSRNQLARNAAIGLGNTGDPRAAPALCWAVRAHQSGVVRAMAAWSLGRLGVREAIGELGSLVEGDPEPLVRDEARQALDVLQR